MDGIKGSFDSFRIEEAYNWRDDIMEITRRIVHETDEARLNNIAEHFKVDLSEIREFINKKQREKLGKKTHFEEIKGMNEEELARQLAFLEDFNYDESRVLEWLEWLRQEAKE